MFLLWAAPPQLLVWAQKELWIGLHCHHLPPVPLGLGRLSAPCVQECLGCMVQAEGWSLFPQPETFILE